MMMDSDLPRIVAVGPDTDVQKLRQISSERAVGDVDIFRAEDLPTPSPDTSVDATDRARNNKARTFSVARVGGFDPSRALEALTIVSGTLGEAVAAGRVVVDFDASVRFDSRLRDAWDAFLPAGTRLLRAAAQGFASAPAELRQRARDALGPPGAAISGPSEYAQHWIMAARSAWNSPAAARDLVAPVGIVDSGFESKRFIGNRPVRVFDFSGAGNLGAEIPAGSATDAQQHGWKIAATLDALLPREVPIHAAMLGDETHATMSAVAMSVLTLVATSVPRPLVINMSLWPATEGNGLHNRRLVAHILSSKAGQDDVLAVMAAGNDGVTFDAGDWQGSNLWFAVALNSEGRRARYSGCPRDLSRAFCAFGGDERGEARGLPFWNPRDHGTSYSAPLISAFMRLMHQDVSKGNLRPWCHLTQNGWFPYGWPPDFE